jgi:hypothetical protein
MVRSSKCANSSDGNLSCQKGTSDSDIGVLNAGFFKSSSWTDMFEKFQVLN